MIFLERDKPWNKELQLLLVFVIGFNVIPHATAQPLWVTVVAVVCLLWKLLYLMKGIVRPHRLVLNLAAVGFGALVLFEHKTLFGQEPAASLLLVLAGLKLLETNRYRDTMLVVFTCYFLLMTHLLESQTLLSTAYMIADIFFITALMFQIHKKDRRQSFRNLIPSLRLLSMTLPVWILLFFAFPRFSAALWNLQSTGSDSGFSDELDPGSIAKLTQNEETAFRVLFDDQRIPSPETLYWRGAILTETQGMRWKKYENLANQPLEKQLEDPKEKKSLGYEVFLETGFRKWLFVLEFPSSFSTGDRNRFFGIKRRNGFFYESSRDIQTRTVYRSNATSSAPLQQLSDMELAQNLRFPKELDSRVLELAEKLKDAAENQNQKSTESLAKIKAEKVISWFQDQNFRYTREPGALIAKEPAAQMTEFLFTTRKGFCEHYASAFATLMRAMGVPARVVVGFQGGKPNNFGSYLLVRKLDAHAWAEVFEASKEDAKKGRWVRFDPTAVIAPLRLQLGGDYNLLDGSILTGGLSTDELRRRLNSGAMGLFGQINLAWDFVQMRWNSFLINFDFEYQLELLRKIGLEGISWLGLFSAVVIILSLIAVLWSRLYKLKMRSEDPVVIEWRRFCLTLEKTGIRKNPTEGPLDFSNRASSLRPDLAERIISIAEQFMNLRYGPMTDSERKKQWREFRQSVRRFSINETSRSASS